MNNSPSNESRSILLAVDGSPLGKSAAFAAASVASTLRCGIHAVYVVDLSQAFDLFGRPEQEAAGQQKVLSNAERVSKLEERGNAALAEVDVICRATNTPLSTEMILGEVAGIILGLADNYRLLALGRSGLSRQDDPRHMGASFSRIADKAQIPLLIGCSDRQQEFLRALVVYDGSDASKETVKWAERLQSMFMDVIVVPAPASGSGAAEQREQLRAEILASALSHYRFVGEGAEYPSGIPAIASSEKADMILVPVQSISRVSGPEALESMLRAVEMPVLAIR